MPNYIPPPTPLEQKDLPAYLWRELNRVGKNLADSAELIFYRTLPYTDDSLTAGASANYKIAQGNVIRISTSNTFTLTGLAVKQYNREIVILNVGTGVLSFKSQGAESSASHRFALGINYQISAGYAVTFWYDLASSRWRALSRS